MHRSLGSESCRGLHLVFALTQLFLVDCEITVLTPANRQRLRDRLVNRVQQAVESQLPDGSWPMRWAPDGFHGNTGNDFTPEPTRGLRVTVAGHLLEWF